MPEMTIEWVIEDDILRGDFSEDPECKPIVRLPAVDQVIAEAVKFAEIIANPYSGSPEGTANWHDAKAFLDGDTVDRWRKRQEEGESHGRRHPPDGIAL